MDTWIDPKPAPPFEQRLDLVGTLPLGEDSLAYLWRLSGYENVPEYRATADMSLRFDAASITDARKRAVVLLLEKMEAACDELRRIVDNGR